MLTSEQPDPSVLALCRALAPIPSPDGSRQWMAFSDPVDTLVAWELSEVLPLLRRVEAAAQSGLWAVGFVSYDAGPAFDTAIASHRDEHTPLAAFGLFNEARPDDPLLDQSKGDAFECGTWTPTVSQQQHESAVRAIKGHIAAGDTYQVNLTLRLHASFRGDPLGLFRALARSQQGDHLVFLDFGDRALCSASPELFLRFEPLPDGGTRIVSKPMKGTRPRHCDPETDHALATELVTSEKDQAENTMIVDMMRNDLGRLARVGSVHVSDLHNVEHYPTVHQMVTTVSAETEASLTEVFAASFPPASITGAPKFSTSKIITELEADARGSYCGTAGVVGPDGMAEFNVAIRSVWVDLQRQRATYGTGGGIVWESDPTDEWQETRAKTRVLESAPAPFELFETMLYEPASAAGFGGITLIDRHLERLASSAVRFGFDLDVDDVRLRLESVAARSAQRVRLTVGPDGSMSVQTVPINPSIGEPWSVPVDVGDNGQPSVRSDDLFLAHKTTRRSVYDAARARHAGAPDVILWNERNELTETTIGNLVLDLDGQLVTPPLSSGLLPGTFRAELLDHDKIIERVVHVSDLASAREVFMINSVRGWVPLEVATGIG